MKNKRHLKRNMSGEKANEIWEDVKNKSDQINKELKTTIEALEKKHNCTISIDGGLNWKVGLLVDLKTFKS